MIPQTCLTGALTLSARPVSPTLITRSEALESLTLLLRSWGHTRAADGQEDYLRQLLLLEEYDPEEMASIYSPTRKPLLYLVNFPSGGYAVLSADRRIPVAVPAVVERGSIDPDHFDRTPPTMADVRRELPDLPSDDYAMSAGPELLYHRLYHYAAAYVEEEGVGSATVTERQITKEVPMMMRTIWGQHAPFNALTPLRRRYGVAGPQRHAPAGCGPIAAAQILNDVGLKDFSHRGMPIDLSLLRHFYSIDRPRPYDPMAAHTAALFLHALGSRLHTWYSYSFGMTMPMEAAFLFEKVGLTDVRRTLKADERRRELLAALDRHCPAYVTSGSRLNAMHSWVIDGYRQEQVVSDSGAPREELYVHCNYGWYGSCNGYYAYDLFDTRAGAVALDEAERRHFGSDSGTRSYHFRFQTNIITFDRENN